MKSLLLAIFLSCHRKQRLLDSLFLRLWLQVCSISHHIFLTFVVLGVPVVAIGANGILDIIDHGRTGLLAYPPHDTVQQLIDNVRLLVNDPLLRQKMSLQGREWAEQWNWKSATQKLRASQYRAAISLHQIRQSRTIDHAHSPSDSLNSIGGLISFFHKFFLVHLLKYIPNENILAGEMEIMRKYSV